MTSTRQKTWPLVRGVTAATLTSAIGITINVATDLKSSAIAWTIVSVLTAASGVTGVVTAPKSEQAGSHWSIRRGKWGQSSHAQGVVMHVEIEIRPDGTRIERRDYFDVDLARGHIDGS